MIILVDGLILGYVAFLFASLLTFPNQGLTIVATYGMFVPGFVVYKAYRSKKVWAYWCGVIVLILASLLFAINAFLSLISGLSGGGLSEFFFFFLMGWATLGSSRRAMFHWHPGYRSGYMTGSMMSDFALDEGEMFAACPSCLAVLAIKPMMLGAADRCPHCTSRLVSQELLERYGGQTERLEQEEE